MQIITKNLTHIYEEGQSNEVAAVSDVSISISSGEFLGIVGHTGSGKTTLVQHFNGLLKPTSGQVIVGGKSTETTPLPESIRYGVGFVFQYPEDQLFADTVFDEVAFGLRNMGLCEDEISKRVKHSLGIVGLTGPGLEKESPFHLSGGQQRRLVISCVLAMKPSTIVLDEPTAGLDPQGKKAIMDVIQNLHDVLGLTIILISHDMEIVTRYVDRIIVMKNGQVAGDGSVRDILWRVDDLSEFGLEPPQVIKLMKSLRDKKFVKESQAITVSEAAEDIISVIRG